MISRRALLAGLITTAAGVTVGGPEGGTTVPNYAQDDLAAILTPPPTAAGGISFGQGVVLDWDPLTAANRIDYRGATLTNLSLLNSSEAVLLRPGAVVAILSWQRSYFILGRITVPNTPEAATALDMIRVYSTDADGTYTTGTTSGLVVHDDGPVVRDVLVSKSGRAIVTVSADITAEPAPSSSCTAAMTFVVSGATERTADTAEAVGLRYVADNATLPAYVQVAASKQTLVTGLNPGVHTFTSMYQVTAGGSGDATFASRNLTVIPY